MPIVDTNPDDLRRFARLLRSFRSDVDGRLNALNAAFRSLHFNDDQQRRFAQEWESTSRSMKAFLQEAEKYAPYLEKKARQLDEYLR